MQRDEREQRQAIANGAVVKLVSSLGDVHLDCMEKYGSIDRTEFLGGPDLKNIGLVFEQLTSLNQLPDDTEIRIHGRKETAAK